MKRNFLLMLLMTLLPLAGWAADAIVVNTDGTQGYAVLPAEGGLAASDLAVKVGETTYTGTSILKEDGVTAVATITEMGNYYLEANGKFYPFQVAKKATLNVDYDFVWNAATYTASQNGRGIAAYQAGYPSADWYNKTENKRLQDVTGGPKVEPTEAQLNGYTRDWESAVNCVTDAGWIEYGYPRLIPFSADGTKYRWLFQYALDEQTLTEDFRAYGAFGNGTTISQLFETVIGDGLGTRIASKEDALTTTPTILFGEQGTTPSTFDINKLTALMFPAKTIANGEGGALDGPYEIQVTPQSGVIFPWHSDFDLTDPSVNPDLVITCTSTVLNYDVNLVPGLKEAVIQKLIVNEAAALSTADPDIYTYSLGLKDEADKQVIVGGVVYLIAPVSDGQVVIGKAKNEFAKDDEGNVLYPVLKTGLTYTAAEQDLIANAGTAAFNKIEYAVVSKTTDDTTVPEAPTTGWGLEAKKIDAGEYYVWARPAADDAGFWAEGDPVLLKEEVVDGATADPNEFATIAKATPQIVGPITLTPAGVGENNRYFLNKYTTENPLTITPSGAKVQFNGQDLAGATITYVTWNPANAQGASTNFTYTAVNNYKIQARFVATGDLEKNFNNVLSQAEPVEVAFQVADRPAVTVTVSEPAIVGQGTNPVFDYTTVWEDGAYEDGAKGNIVNGQTPATTTATYRWYRTYSETNGLSNRVQDSEFTNGTPTATGTYYVQIHKSNYNTSNNLTSATHEVVIGAPLKVQVVAGDIEAEIADRSGENGTEPLIYGQPLPLTLTHRSGLAEEDVDAFEEHIYTDGQFTATKILNADGSEVPEAERVATPLYRWRTNYIQGVGRPYLYTALPVGTYKVSANITSNNNQTNGGTTTGFNVFVADATWKVVAKDITNADLTEGDELYVRGLGSEFGNDADFELEKEYIGAAIVPSAEDMNMGTDFWGKANYRYSKMVYGTDYEIIVPETEDNVNAGEVTFTISGKGNFTGSTNTMKFTITKAEMAVKPATGQSWTVGTTEENKYKLDEDGMKAQLKGKDKADGTDPLNVLTAPGFNKLAVKRVCSTNIGNHADGLKAYKTDEGAEDEVFAKNYYFTFEDANADLAIEPGTINLKVKDVTVTYKGKDAEPTIAHEFEVAEGSTLSELLADNWKLIVTGWNSDAITWSTEGKPENGYVAGTYEDFFGCSVPEGTLSANNYNVAVTDNEGTLTINRAKITLKAADQGPMTLEAVENGGFNANPVFGDNATVDLTGDIFDPITDIVASIQKPTVVKAGENTLTLVTKTNDNYDYGTPATGILYVGAGEGEPLVLALTSNMDDYTETVEIKATQTINYAGDWSKLAAYEGVDVDVITLQLKPATLTGVDAFSAWNADEWHAMVLPFAVTVKELSKAFDYAYVNVVDPDATKEGDVRFKLANILDTIPANTPFCIKASVAYRYAGEMEDVASTDEDESEAYELTFDRTRSNVKFKVNLTGVDENWAVAGVKADNATPTLGYMFAGTYAEDGEFAITKDTKDALRFLGTVGGVNKWYYIGDASTKTCTLPPYTGFVNLGAKSAGVREVSFTFEEEDGSTTTIKAVDFFNGKSANDDIYTVDGMKVNAPTQKGVYIQNGKKVLVK